MVEKGYFMHQCCYMGTWSIGMVSSQLQVGMEVSESGVFDAAILLSYENGIVHQHDRVGIVATKCPTQVFYGTILVPSVIVMVFAL